MVPSVVRAVVMWSQGAIRRPSRLLAHASGLAEALVPPVPEPLHMHGVAESSNRTTPS